MTLRLKKAYFPKQHQTVDICHEGSLYFEIWTEYYLDELVI
jgi:hypothetical protein